MTGQSVQRPAAGGTLREGVSAPTGVLQRDNRYFHVWLRRDSRGALDAAEPATRRVLNCIRSSGDTMRHPRTDMRPVTRGEKTMIKSPIRLASALALAVLLVACGSRVSQENYNKISNGMPYEEVVKILGQPQSSEGRGLLGVTASTSEWKDGKHEIMIVFVNEKVTSKMFHEMQAKPEK
jgi:hypothetical protein